MEELKKIIRNVPDFPKPGIVFKDITPLLANADAFRRVIKIFGEKFSGERITKIIGIESRGFIFAAALSMELGVGFIPVRKAGKLPWTKISEEYVLEYGTDRLEMHDDALIQGDRVLILDDVLATGGTAKAVTRMVESQKAQVVALSFLIELDFLKGREQLKGHEIFSILHY